eukprot:145626-Pyramimonas_sp.AAC.1
MQTMEWRETRCRNRCAVFLSSCGDDHCEPNRGWAFHDTIESLSRGRKGNCCAASGLGQPGVGEGDELEEDDGLEQPEEEE